MTKTFLARSYSSSASFDSSSAMSPAGILEGSFPLKASFPPMSRAMMLNLSFSGKKFWTAPIRAPGRDKILKFGKSRWRA